MGVIDGDADVDIGDLTLLTAHLTDVVGNCGDPNNLTCEQFARADYNDDGELTFGDDFTALLSGYGAQTAVNNYVAFTWDAENRLIAVEPLARPIQDGWQRVEFEYDYRGRRIEKRVYDKDTTTAWETNPTQRRRFVWNGWLMVMETIDIDSASDGTFETQRIKKYTWGRDLGGSLESAGGIGGLLAVHDDNGASTDINAVYCYDANGNVGQLVDLLESSAGAGMLAKYEYDVYGNVTSSGGSYATDNTYRFSTKPWDDETGLGYWGYRYYDPRVGRWLSRDPITEAGGLNLYASFNNKSSSIFDALGLTAIRTGTLVSTNKSGCSQGQDNRPDSEPTPRPTTGPTAGPLADPIRYCGDDEYCNDRCDQEPDKPHGITICNPLKRTACICLCKKNITAASAGDVIVNSILRSCAYEHEIDHVWQCELFGDATAATGHCAFFKDDMDCVAQKGAMCSGGASCCDALRERINKLNAICALEAKKGKCIAGDELECRSARDAAQATLDTVCPLEKKSVIVGGAGE